jgi:L-iditol 2-dehydrogenase
MTAPARMDVAALTGIGQARILHKPIPRVGDDYALVRVEVAPMCNEYVAFTEGRYLERNRPDSLGHEFAGEVISAPADAAVDPGDRVVALCGFPCRGLSPMPPGLLLALRCSG